MRYVSLFSGVEAATVAWSRLGWEPLAFAEVDEFPSAVLAYRFPGVPNLGDVCKVDWEEFNEKHGAIDVLIGGSPCQSFSIAGNREGLEGESRLMYEYVRAVRELVRASGGASPRYIVWENVPGCLSSNKGRDFGCLLDELEDCGYFVAWRTLDSQFARVFDRSGGGFAGPVPQRRRRVFLVGSLGGPSAADILFERKSMLGDHPKGREAREALARGAEGGAGMGDSEGCVTPWDVQSNSAYVLKVRGGSDTYVKWDGKTGTAGKGALVSEEVAFTLSATQDQTLFEHGGDRYVVRRLMPVETERLQAFPDGWTDITGCDVDAITESVAESLGYGPESKERKALRRKVEKWSKSTPDTPRYKAMGNSMTTYVIELLGRRIQAYDELHYDEVGLGFKDYE